MESLRYSGIPSYRSIHSSNSTPDVLSEGGSPAAHTPSSNFLQAGVAAQRVASVTNSSSMHQTVSTSTNAAVGASAYIESPLAQFTSASHIGRSASTRDSSGLEKLLRDAQSQVRELLPHREENVRLSTELSIQKSILTEKEEEVKKLQRLVVEERNQRQQLARKSAEDQSNAVQRGDAKARIVEDKVLELERTLRDCQGELERKNRNVRHLEEELVQARSAKQEDRTKLGQKDTLLNTVEAERNRAVSQLEEAARGNHKLEQVKKELESQLSALRQELDRSRREVETLRREKSDSVAEALQSQNKVESLQRRVESLHEETVHLQQLRATVVQMEPLKEELALLRRAVETGEQGIHSERMSRKNIEAERDQLLLRVRGLETDVRRLESDCHRAQADASERIPLRRENEDLRHALDEANAHLTALQADLTQERGQRTTLQSKWERTFTAVARTVQTLRCSLETRTAPLHHQRENDVSSVTGGVPPTASPIAVGASTYLQSQNYSRDDALNESTDRYPTAGGDSGDHGAIDLRLVTALDPLKSGIGAVLEELLKEQIRRKDLAGQLQDEQLRNSKLEHHATTAEKSITHSQLELTAAAGRETQAIRQLRHLEEELHRARIQSKDRSAQVYRLLASDEQHANVEFDAAATDDASFQRLVEVVRVTVSQRDRERRQRISLEAELKQAHEHAEAAHKSHQELLNDVELKCQKELRSIQLVSEHQMEETSKIHADLRAAIQISVERYESVMQELQELKSKHHETLVQLGEREQAVLDARHEADLLKRESSLSATLLQKEKLSVKEAAAAHGHIQDELTSVLKRLRDEEHRGTESEANASSLQQTTILLGRVVLGQRSSLETLTLERYWAVQHAKCLEQSLKALLNACPADGIIAAVPQNSSRRDQSCSKLLRYSTLRPVVLAVIAALRLQRMYFSIRTAGVRAARVQSTIVLGAPPMRVAKSKGRTILLPQVGELSARALCSALVSSSITRATDNATSPSRLRDATSSHPWDVDATVQSILDVLQSSTSAPPGVCWKRSFSFMWDMAAGLTRRNALLVGTNGQSKLASAAVKQFLRATHDGMAMIERSLESAKRENNSLVEMVQVKEQRIQSLNEELSATHDEKRRMVPRRDFEAAEVALRETRHALAEEQIHHHTATERIASLKSSEAHLLLRQSELQNESRALAIELTRKSAMLTSSPTRQQRNIPSPLEEATRHDNTRRDHSPSPIIARTSALGTSALGAGHSKAFPATVDHQQQHHQRHYSSNVSGSSTHLGGGGGAAASTTTTTRVTSQTFARSSDNDIMMLIRGIDEKLSGALHR